jgi:hypothetical protein
VPDSGRSFFQVAFSAFDRSSAARVHFLNPDRAPLLLIAGESDRAMPATLVRRTFRAYRGSPARTEFRAFPGRTHWLIAQDGWEEVAQACIDWIGSLRAAAPPGLGLTVNRPESRERVLGPGPRVPLRHKVLRLVLSGRVPKQV